MKERHLKKSVVIPILVAIVIVAAGIINLLIPESIGKIPADTVGNTAGNLRGQGLFCEYDGKVYFSNAYDGGALYVMNPDGTDIKKLLESRAEFINIGGNNIFYYMQSAKGGTGLGYVRSMSGIYRCNLKGNKAKCINSGMTTQMVLAGENLYYQHYDNDTLGTYNKILKGGLGGEETLSYRADTGAACVYDGKIWYGGLEKDFYLHAIDLSTDTDSVVWNGASVAEPTVAGNLVYYMDIDNNYRLCVYDRSANQVSILTKERIDFYNVYGNVIFYQTAGKTPALMRMTADGGNKETIREGVYNRINTTSVYTYFYEFGVDDVVYRVPTFGGTSADTFPEAQMAVK